MRIAAIGCGHPGGVRAAAMASLGHSPVVGTHTDARVVVDDRTALDAGRWSAAGFEIVGLGRPEVEAA